MMIVGCQKRMETLYQKQWSICLDGEGFFVFKAGLQINDILCRVFVLCIVS